MRMIRLAGLILLLGATVVVTAATARNKEKASAAGGECNMENSGAAMDGCPMMGAMQHDKSAETSIPGCGMHMAAGNGAAKLENSQAGHACH